MLKEQLPQAGGSNNNLDPEDHSLLSTILMTILLGCAALCING